ncbi:putative COMM domain-containing protein [Helianthus annuus]|nr:putative COMM domain-containing protein [Helianthus annuus]KAJ0713161.1 putative COMM domain-containing protein [Helianthus annuus]
MQKPTNDAISRATVNSGGRESESYLVTMEHSLWGNLPLLVRANSKESVEYILQTLWKTRKVGLDSADRDVIRDLLQLQNDADLDPVITLHLFIFHNRYCYSFISLLKSLEFTLCFDCNPIILIVNTVKKPNYLLERANRLFTVYTYSVGRFLLVCLRMLIRKCVCENANKDEIQKLFPAEVLPEIQRLLTLLLQKFHREWREDISKDQVLYCIKLVLYLILLMYSAPM